MRRWATATCVLAILALASSAMAGTIADAKAAADGAVTIDNAVIASATDMTNSTNSKSISIQDSTGGITIYGHEDAAPPYPATSVDAILAVAGEGDTITITANKSSYLCLAQLNLYNAPNPTFSKTGTGSVPAPVAVTCSDFQSPYSIEAQESMIVQLDNVTFVNAGGVFTGGTSGSNYTVTGTGGSVVVRIATQYLDIHGQTIPTGPVNIIGVVTQSSCSPVYQIQPRSMADIIGPPYGVGQKVYPTKGGSPVTITLNATDPQPGPDPDHYLYFSIVSGSAVPNPNGPSFALSFPGTLTDPYDSDDVTAGGLLHNHGNQVTYTPNSTGSGWFQFKYTIYDGGNTSGEVTVSLLVQDTGRVVITEFMCDPANVVNNNWQWVEVTNLTASDILLDTIYDKTLANPLYNLWDYSGPQVLPAGTTKIIARQDNASRTLADFIIEWSPLSTVLTFGAGGEPVFYYTGGDSIHLFASDGTLLDVVRYESGTNGWPATNNRSSIFLTADNISTTANDVATNWRSSVPGINGAWETPETLGPPADSDAGSPGVLPTPPTVDATPPTASSATIYMSAGAPRDIWLEGSGSGTLSYIIEYLPTAVSPTTGSGGTFADPNGGTIATVPYTLLSNGNVVTFTPPGPGVYCFGYRVSDGTYQSAYTYIYLYVQSVNSVVITEIMYKPANLDLQDNYSDDWQYIEIYNSGASTVNLGTYWDAYRNAPWINNLAGTSIAPGETKVLTVAAEAGGRTLADFVTQWAPASLTLPQVVGVNRSYWWYLNYSVGERLYLFDSAGGLLDTVNYGVGGSWPSPANGASIFLSNGFLTAADNDSAANWKLSIDGFENAVASASGKDVGSPGRQANGSNYPPSAVNVRAGVVMNSTNTPITLVATDDGLPSNTIDYIIQTLPARGGSLSDPNGGAIATVPYTLLSHGAVVNYTPATGYTSAIGGVGNDTFTFKASDGAGTSPNTGLVTPVVQKGGVVISEIMYDPANVADNDWEWIEVYNTTASAVTVQIFTDNDGEPDGNLVVATAIPAYGVKVITSGNNDSRTTAQFLQNWYNLASGDLIAVGNTASWEQLGNTGNIIQILDDSGYLLDEVPYGALSPWPVNNNQSSIYVQTGYLDPIANDSGANWALSAAGVDGAYQTHTIAQGGATDLIDVGSPGAIPSPILSVTPANQNVANTAGSTTFTVSNTGGGSMAYTSATGDSWLHIVSNGSGSCPPNAIMGVNVDANPANSPQRIGTITVTATGATGSPATVTVTQAAGPTCTTLAISSAVSQRTHGTSGTYDRASGSVEGRSNGPTKIVTTFNQPVHRVTGTPTDFSLSSGTLGTVTVAGAVVTANVSGVANMAIFTICYPGIASDCDNSTTTACKCWKVLQGDTNGVSPVNNFDILAIRGVLGQTASSSTYTKDVNASGKIDNFDMLFTRGKLTNAVTGTCTP